MADRSVKIIVSAAVAGVVSGMRTAQGAVTDFSKRSLDAYAKNQQALDHLGNSTLKVGVGLTALAGFAVKSAMDWETSWTGVLKTVDGTPQQLAKVEDGLRSLAKETGFAHSEVAAVGEAAGQLGISTGGIVKFTDTMLAMGVSTNLSSEEAATGLARFRNIMGSSEAEVSNMGSSIVALGNNFATTEREILDMSMRLAGAGRQAGISEAGVLGIAAAMSSVGIEAEAGGTAMSMTMKRIGKEVETGGPKLGLFAQVAGTSAKQFKKAWDEDAAGTLATFIKGLGKTEEMGMSTNAVLTELGVTGIREADSLLRLSSNSEGLAAALGKSEEGWRQNIALMAEADKFYGTSAQKSKQAWASIKDSAIDAGDSMLPIVAKLADGVAGLAGAFGRLPAPVQSALTGITGIGGVSLVAMAGLIKMGAAVTTTKAALDALALSGSRTGAGIGILAGAVGRASIGLAAFYAISEGGDFLTGKSSEDVDKLSKSLKGFADTGKATGKLKEFFGTDLGGTKKGPIHTMRELGDEITKFEKRNDDGWFTKARRNLSTLGTSLIDYDSVEKLKALDQAFTQLSQNNPDAAISAFERLRDAALEQGATVEDIQRVFPTMTGLLRSTSEAMGGTSDASEILNGSLTELAPAAQMSAEEMQAMEDAARDTANSFFDITGGADSADLSLAQWTQRLKEQAKALRDFTKNSQEAGKKGLKEGLIAELQAAGPEGARIMSMLAGATKREIAAANKAWESGQLAIGDYIALTGKVPPEKGTKLKVTGAQAGKVMVDALRTAIDNLRGKSVTIETVRRTIKESYSKKGSTGGNNPAVDDAFGYTGLRIPAGYASGGQPGFSGRVPGTPPADPTRDNMLAVTNLGNPIRVRSREWIINEEQSEKNDKWLALINAGLNLDDIIPGFASGGRASALEIMSQQRTVRDLERSLREREAYGNKRKGKKRRTRLVLKPGSLDRKYAQLELAEAKQELRELRAGTEAKRERLDEAVGARDSVADGLAGGFGLAQFVGKNAFGQSTAATGATIAAGAKTYAAKVKVFAGKLEKARKLGIPVAMLQEVAGMGVEEGTLALDALLSASSSDIATIRTAYKDIDTYAKSAGEVIAKALDLTEAGKDSAAGYAKGFITGLNAEAKSMGKAAKSAAKGQQTRPVTSSGTAYFSAPAPQTHTAIAWGGAPSAPAPVTLAASDMDRLAQSMAAVWAANPIDINAVLAISGRQAVSITDLAATTTQKQG